ncbi:MAG: anaerobic ribonucleoside-triphosphate reductase activating protein [Oscillospiraceae bacterium]
MLENDIKPIHTSGMIWESIVDGPGIRFVLFTQGCPHHCKGCHNPTTHPFEGGQLTYPDEIIQQLKKNTLISGVTFSGGEPFAQAEALVPLAEQIKAMGKHLMCYTGYTFEQLMAMNNSAVNRLLSLADLLVDGRFIEEQKSLTLRFRGSANQRIIDLPETLRHGEVVISPYSDR